ncbi:DUF1360 domain-containing protein [Streptomyces triticagri]|uniref:DUF1360 domain-containing protein n=1 Tax=Streptomyces triticagri TaxID=2293568 RepID=A0A372LZB6_9ACTN|nr:DUF1360 domain-containing protein [Streptomyces triticagri]RFU83595.1 DUF1360 domain-containing protein [Streptomyces triticagri]
MTWTLAVIGLLTFGAAARLTRLVTTDTLTAPLREHLARRSGTAQLAAVAARTKPKKDQDKAEQARLDRRVSRRQTTLGFATCDWCVGFWASALTFALLFRYNSGAWPWDFNAVQTFLYAITVLASSYLIGLAAEVLPDGHAGTDPAETAAS